MDSNIVLKEYSNYRIGGAAKFFTRARDVDSLWNAIAFAKMRALPYFILGGGTNVLFSDEGFNGVVIQPAMEFLEKDGAVVTAGAGASMAALLAHAAQEGLSGLEWAGGLPGTVGGAVRGNAGAFGGETKDVIIEVVSLDVSGDAPLIRKRAVSACRFGYRTSIFKEKKEKEIIISVSFALRKGDRNAIAAAVEDKMRYRKERHPMEYPNIGSIFKNVPIGRFGKEFQGAFTQVIKTDPFPVVPAAYLISEAGMRGVKRGGAMVSEKHPNFIVNISSARAIEVREIISAVSAAVQKKYGVMLEEEIICV